ncbi:hypothetical protein DVH24_035428 [Malus domestica]|uniref:Uncharacterized protein n=1 Tax=Malus domestica TaxID=3750 RepID=A0A498J949_MALDO|nr:hypothetical protein DVH24_035428 [Malus domestica]
MGDPLGSSHVSSQKQNLEGVVGAQSEQYSATAELSPDVVGVWAGIINKLLSVSESIVLMEYAFYKTNFNDPTVKLICICFKISYSKNCNKKKHSEIK